MRKQLEAESSERATFSPTEVKNAPLLEVPGKKVCKVNKLHKLTLVIHYVRGVILRDEAKRQN